TAFQVPDAAGASEYTALCFAPDSTWSRRLAVYFDNDNRPWPLVGDDVIHRRFKRLRVEPLDPYTALGSASVSNAQFSGGLNINPRLNRQVLRLLLFRQPPPPDWHPRIPETVTICQRFLNGTQVGAPTGGTDVLHAHVAGCERIKLFASND